MQINTFHIDLKINILGILCHWGQTKLIDSRPIAFQELVFIACQLGVGFSEHCIVREVNETQNLAVLKECLKHFPRKGIQDSLFDHE